MTRPVDGASTQREGGDGNRRRRDRHRRGERGDRRDAHPVEPGAEPSPVRHAAHETPAPSALAALRLTSRRRCNPCRSQPSSRRALPSPPKRKRSSTSRAAASSRRAGNRRAGTAACATAASAGDAASGVDVAAGGFGSRVGRDAIEGNVGPGARAGSACGTAPRASAARGRSRRAVADHRNAQGRSAAGRLTFAIGDREEGGPGARLLSHSGPIRQVRSNRLETGSRWG